VANETLAPNTRFISLMVGRRLKLFRPGGYPGVEYAGGDAKYYSNGFKILYPELGEFTESSSDDGKSWVIYKHLKSGKQVIEFISDSLGTVKFHLVAQGVQIHDHASIEMGGPAFATYYTEPTTPVEEGT